MLEKLEQYKILKKSKYELAVDKIVKDINQRWWISNGYYDIYYLGVINLLQMIAKHIKKYGSMGQDEIQALLKGYQDVDDMSYDVKNLISLVLEEFDCKGE